MAENERVIVLKSRQLGLTWLTLGLCLYEATFWGNRLFLLASKREDEGKEMLRRVRLMHDTLPPEWRAPRKTGDDSKLSMSFSNGCKFQVLPATQSLARSYAAYAAVIDEMAFMPYQSEMWAAVEPAARRIRCISTGYRKADLYYDLWDKAYKKQNEFVAIFLPWWSSPRRDQDWYEMHVTNAPRVRLARREYCSNPEEAFTSAEGLFFDRFDQTIHTKDFDVKRDWTVYRAVDFGYRHAACVWFQVSKDGQIRVFGELCPKSRTTGEFAADILAMDQQLEYMFGMPKPMLTFCDPAGYSKNTQTATSDIEIFNSCGLFPIAKQSAKRDGCVLIAHHLLSRKNLIIHNNCRELITSFETLEPDTNAPEVYANDDEFDHVMDALRYGMVNVAMGAAGHFADIGATVRSNASPITAGMYDRIY